MPRYLFVFDERTGAFPERYRLVKPGEDPDALRAAEELTGTIPEAAVDAVLEALTAACPPGGKRRAEIVHATDWDIVKRSYADLFRD